MRKERKKRLLRIARRAKERREARHPVTHGKLSMSASGFGFVTPPPGDGGIQQEDIFIPPQFVNGAVDGDMIKMIIDDNTSTTEKTPAISFPGQA